MKQNELPTWAEQSKIDFRYAAPWMKAAAKASKFSPRWFATQQQRNGEQIAYCWNSKRIEKYDQDLQNVAEQYLR